MQPSRTCAPAARVASARILASTGRMMAPPPGTSGPAMRGRRHGRHDRAVRQMQLDPVARVPLRQERVEDAERAERTQRRAAQADAGAVAAPGGIELDEVDIDPALAQLDGGRHAGESATDDQHASRHAHAAPPSPRCQRTPDPVDRGRPSAEHFGDPVRDVVTGIRAVVEARVLDAAFTLGEHLQLTSRAVDQLFVGALRPLQRDLRILLAVRHEERHPDAIENAVEMHRLDDPHEVVDVLRAPHPADVGPVMRHGQVAFARAPLVLHGAPVVVRAPHDATRKPRLERHRARAEVSAQRDAFEPDTGRVDVVALLQPVDDGARPVLAVVARRHAGQTQRFAGARLIDHERGDAAPGQPRRQPDAVLHLLGGIEAVDLHQQWARGPRHPRRGRRAPPDAGPRRGSRPARSSPPTAALPRRTARDGADTAPAGPGRRAPAGALR